MIDYQAIVVVLSISHHRHDSLFNCQISQEHNTMNTTEGSPGTFDEMIN